MRELFTSVAKCQSTVRFVNERVTRLVHYSEMMPFSVVKCHMGAVAVNVPDYSQRDGRDICPLLHKAVAFLT